MSCLKASMVGFDVTPRFHPDLGAWGTTQSLTGVDLPLMGRCLALEQDGRRLLWFGMDLVGETVSGTNALRDEIADAVGITRDQVVWSTSQTHSSGALPGSTLTGCSLCGVSDGEDEFARAERIRFMDTCIAAAREALDSLQPVNVWAGRGFCDQMSYNTRFPMPMGGVKFSRDHAEGRQSGKFYDPTIGLVRFEDKQGNALGAIFNFCAHPATMILSDTVSPDYVGTARRYIENTMSGAPAMFVQGFCGDVNCNHIFGTPDLARRNGEILGRAAAEAMKHLVPVRPVPFEFAWRTVDLPCRPMYTREEIESCIAQWEEYARELEYNPKAVWVAGINYPEGYLAEQKLQSVDPMKAYFREGLRILEYGEIPRSALPITLGAIRIGDIAAAISPGENFTATGRNVRIRSPFAHTLICGDTNGLFGYIGDDAEINRGGYECDTYWKLTYIDGFRLALTKGSADRVIGTLVDLISGRSGGSNDQDSGCKKSSQ